MVFKEMWEKYQIAAAFAEENEHETAVQYLEEDVQEQLSTAGEDRLADDRGKGILRPSHAEG